MINPRDARIASCALVLLAGGVVANVAYLQGGPRERRKPFIPVGMNVPPPGAQAAGEVRRPAGPVTLSLASLIEAGQGDEPSESPAASPASSSPASSNRMSGIAQAIDHISPPPPQIDAADRPRDLAREVQTALAGRGYEPGPADGEVGLLTRAAILAFEHDHGLPATAEASEPLLAALRSPAQVRRPAGTARQTPSRTAAGIVRAVQQQLIAAGYLRGNSSGQLDARTIAAIRAFEAANELTPTGRISAPLIAKLQRTGTRRATVASGQ